MAIPQHHPATAHLPWSDPRVDTVYVLNLAARTSRIADMNAVRGIALDWNLHWVENPVLNHYDWIWTGKRTRFLRREIRREMTHEEKHRPVDEWHDRAIGRWRRGPRGGAKPCTVGKRQRQARRRGVTIAWELKSRDYGEADYAERFVSAVKASGGRAWYFTLAKMRNWGPKLKAFHLAGGEVALDVNEALEPARSTLSEWRPWIDAIWGHYA
jgi:hypothetical protein